MSKIFVVDGTDGSGKQTQIEKLCSRMEAEGIPYAKYAFPRYENPSSTLVKMYLAGEFGSNAQEINPYITSLFYAVDRYACYKQEMEKAIEDGKVILLDRYTTANMVHQAGKISDLAERDKFLDWLYELEFGLIGLPLPTEVFFLDMPLEKAKELMANRPNKITHEKKKDIHESSEEHLKAAYNAGVYVAEKYHWYHVLCCAEDGSVRPIDEIHEEIYSEIKKHIC
ncbi:MAG: thymidylate kinase [Clostridia bacterium]|nr:thymidylate kinase [Clostridia bacterium]